MVQKIFSTRAHHFSSSRAQGQTALRHFLASEGLRCRMRWSLRFVKNLSGGHRPPPSRVDGLANQHVDRGHEV